MNAAGHVLDQENTGTRSGCAAGQNFWHGLPGSQTRGGLAWANTGGTGLSIRGSFFFEKA